ncbi:polysaccharide deacetylase family protein [Zoogloeaceae bacterium G21618-S1]|nr:polysaccharide deacetylase family protein [Zoogloeaceae bacterium G21618-S1]
MLMRGALRMVSAVYGPRLTILIFHRVLSEPDPLFPDEVDCARFDQIVEWIASWFEVIPLEKAIAGLKSGVLPPRAACITFDDGYADNLTNAVPILKKHDVSATFFIATGFLDGGVMWNDRIIESIRQTNSSELDCSWLGCKKPIPVATVPEKRSALAVLISAIKHLPAPEREDAVERVTSACGVRLPLDLMLSTTQVRQLRSADMGVGAHTVSHPILANLQLNSARSEIADGRDTLEEILGERVGLFAYPNGKPGIDYLPEHVEMVESLGFDGALSTAWGANRYSSSVYELRRFTPWDRTRLRYSARLLSNYISKQ